MSQYRNPATHLRVPEPHFIPGYAGFCPDLVDKIGITYPWATYAVMAEQPDIAMRLAPIKPPKHQYAFQRRNWQPRACGNWLGERKTSRPGVCCSSMSNTKWHEHPHIDCSGDKGGMPKVMDGFCKIQKQIFSKIIDDIERKAREKTGKDDHHHHRHHPCCSSLKTYRKTHC
ncbi:hypothetical protein AVEN_2704-1 [Araneus ventricosus]|uniref:Ciliary microtubule inner protein 2A-C-like domain-containing protein n=1 Tax=Araneus ventricosus TaxID=182803 RepID=A0A4Y2QJ86_ARAVE|nr:hypothetical protein AVEN_2704-1 [Araneus ventricosus]